MIDIRHPKQVDTMIINSSQLLTMTESGAVPGGAVAVKDGTVIETGRTEDLLRIYPGCPDIIGAENHLVMPGFVDCHTHLVFAGERSGEMEMRLRGASYLRS